MAEQFVSRGDFDNSKEKIWDRLNEHSEVIYGRPDAPGLMTGLAVMSEKIGTLVTAERARSHREWAVIMLLIGLVVEAFWRVLT